MRVLPIAARNDFPSAIAHGMIELLTLGGVRLVTGDDSESSLGLAQPKRVALLAYLAVATAETPVRRDVLLALFWPALSEEEGERALRQALYYLRRAIGEDVVGVTGDELVLREASLRCDAAVFERLLRDGRPVEALEVYQGDFLDGFYIDEAGPELEEWVRRTRARLRRGAAGAAWLGTDAAVSAGQTERAIELARRACELEPDQEAGWRRLMKLQDARGDRAGALQTYDALSDRLARELDAKPAPETAALAERIRTAMASGGGASVSGTAEIAPG
jgi:DNA-binding SARP family transcriptional activator